MIDIDTIMGKEVCYVQIYTEDPPHYTNRAAVQLSIEDARSLLDKLPSYINSAVDQSNERLDELIEVAEAERVELINKFNQLRPTN